LQTTATVRVYLIDLDMAEGVECGSMMVLVLTCLWLGVTVLLFRYARQRMIQHYTQVEAGRFVMTV
jgi:hypothetical protein